MLKLAPLDKHAVLMKTYDEDGFLVASAIISVNDAKQLKGAIWE